jgi:CBS domain-containing protein
MARQLEPQEEAGQGPPTTLDLMEIPAMRQELAHTHLQATLQEAWETLRENNVDALYVTHAATSNARVYGVLTRKDIEETYAVGSA